MTIFSQRFYQNGGQQRDTESYREALQVALGPCTTEGERDKLLSQEAVEITRHITEGIRDLVKHEKHIHHLVFNLGAVPLATWTDMLNMMAEDSMSDLERKINKMKYELEHGKVEGFPGTMFLYGKPTFTDFEDFYRIVFNAWHDSKEI